MQVLAVTVLVDALHPALEDGEVTLNRVRVHVAAHVLFRRMGGEVVRRKVVGQLFVLSRFVGVDGGFLGDVRFQDRKQGGHPQVFHDDAFRRARSAVDQGQDLVLVRATTGGFGFLELVADEGFVNLNRAAASAEVDAAIIAHRFTDAMGHEPSGLEGHTKGAVKLLGTDALLGGTHQVDGLQPQVQRDVAGLEDRADANRELGLAIAALFQAVTLNAFRVFLAGLGANAFKDIHVADAATVRADRTLRPKHRLNMGKRCGFVVHVFGGQDRHGGFLALYKEGKPPSVVCQV